MKCKTMRHEIIEFQWMTLLLLFTICFSSCKDDKDASAEPYDPSQPVTVTDFAPKAGGANTRMIIYGSNFGTDSSIVFVKIGGKEAKVINAKGNSLYCITPQQCYEGTIEVKVGEQDVIVSSKYKYVPQKVVSTLCGYVDEKGNGEIIKEGPFSDCGKIDFPAWFEFDPKNHDILYLTQDAENNGNGKPMRILDLKNERIYTGITGSSEGADRLRSMSWTLSKDTMIIACSKGADNAASNIMLIRNQDNDMVDVTDFQNPVVKRLTTSRGCQNSMIHPENGELYYNFFGSGAVLRYDFYQWGANDNKAHAEELFTIQDANWEFNFIVHPSGDYVYMMVQNQHYILRSNYDRVNKRLTTPYIVCGQPGQADYKDLAGTKARLNKPGQGVFVFNKEYEDANKEDCYDFYFTDRNNHCIRKLTPDGVVSTFAGRGSTGMNVHANGYVDGHLRDEARFNYPYALAYDEDTETFYVGDVNTHRIRKIALEKIPEATEEHPEESQPEEGEQ